MTILDIVRERAGSIKNLATRAEMDYRTIYRIIKRKQEPNIKQINRIATALNEPFVIIAAMFMV